MVVVDIDVVLFLDVFIAVVLVTIGAISPQCMCFHLLFSFSARNTKTNMTVFSTTTLRLTGGIMFVIDRFIYDNYW